MQQRRSSTLHPAFGLLAAIILGSAGVQAATAGTWYVSAAATGLNTGVDWPNAFTDLHSALSAAQPGDEIWVRTGVYRPAAAGGDRAASFVLKTGVDLYGGFVGGETARAGRDPLANPTVLSGDLNRNDGGDFFGTGENSYRVVSAVGVGGVVFDGFVVEGGRADGAAGANIAGSADSASAMVIDGSMTLTRCTFRRNWSAGHGALADVGAGSSLTECRFIGNRAQLGGAGLIIEESTATTLTQCEFSDNATDGDGAGMLSRSVTGIEITECLFAANSAQRGAGVFFAPAATGVVSESDFQDNAAAEGGGLAAFQSSPTISLCFFTRNSASLSGGGTFAEAGSPEILHCTFTNNHAAEGITEGLGGQGGSGGGGSWYRGGAGLVENSCYANNSASLGGGLYVIEGNTATVRNCMFVDNRANEAGGMYSLSSTPLVQNCLFADNLAYGGSFAVAGGLTNYFGSATIEDCLFERNRAELGGGGIYSEGEAPIIRRCIFRQNDAYGEAAGWGGGVLNGFNTSVRMENCEFISNTARYGGAVADHFNSTSTMVNCTMVGNRAIEGGAVYGFIQAGASYTNCVLAANLPEQIAGVLPVVSWSLVQGGHPGLGVFDAPAGFVRQANPGEDGQWGTSDDDLGDLRPAANSLLIDAGDPDAVLDPSGLDVGLLSRHHADAGSPDSGQPSAIGRPAVDLGAREFQGTSCPGDFNRDGSVTVPDIFAFLTDWFAGAATADANRSRSLAVDDIFAYLSSFFSGCP